VSPLAVKTLRLVEHLHGHLGWLTVASLAHPAIVLRRAQRRAPLAASASTGLALVTSVLGAFVYPEYRVRLKQELFLQAPTLGWCFERKEHLAVFALALACFGWVAHVAAPRFEGAARERVARMAHRAYVAAFVLALLVAGLGVAVAVKTTF
jgi:hypothetical protein